VQHRGPQRQVLLPVAAGQPGRADGWVVSALPPEAVTRLLGTKPPLLVVGRLLGRRATRADARLFGAAPAR
jgi:hypothetical protein